MRRGKCFNILHQEYTLSDGTGILLYYVCAAIVVRYNRERPTGPGVATARIGFGESGPHEANFTRESRQDATGYNSPDRPCLINPSKPILLRTHRHRHRRWRSLESLGVGNGMMTKPGRNAPCHRRITHGFYDAQSTRSMRSLSCRRLIGARALCKAQRKRFARPGTSANCVIARLPQGHHTLRRWLQSEPMAEPRYISPARFVLLSPIPERRG